MTLNKKTLFFATIYFVITVLAISCANIVPPDGGPKDTTPPVLLSINPSDSNINIKPKKITLRFNKFMEVKDLEKHLNISPLLRIKPSVISYGKRVEITIADTLLRDNTTYKLSLGDALTDNREFTPYGNFNYRFSTGNYFDSLTLKGKIINAFTAMPDTNMSVMLYEANTPDSLLYKTPPIYVTKTNTSGIFEFDILPQQDFRLIAVADDDNNLMYAKYYEQLAFYDGIINPAITSELTNIIYSFIEQAPKDSVLEAKKSSSTGGMRNKNISNKPKSLSYNVRVDTTTVDKRTFDVKYPLYISFTDSFYTYDKDKIYLSYEVDGVGAEATINITQENDSIIINTPWQEDKVYTLRLIKGWAKDTANVELPPSKYIFRTKSKEDYGVLKVNYNDTIVAGNYYTFIYSEQDTIYNGKIKSQVELTYLSPTTYTILVFEDKNNDSMWTTGDLEARRQPEIMIPHESKINVRAGWDNEIDYKAMPMHSGGMRGKKTKMGETNEIDNKE